MIHGAAELLLPAGAALDDLAPDERARYEVHRRTCADCRDLELELGQVMADLALAAPERVPPPDLLLGIRRALATEPDPKRVPGLVVLPPVASAAGPAAPAGELIPLRRPGSRRPLLAALGLAAGIGFLAVGLGARSITLQQDLDRASAQVAALGSALAQRGNAMTVVANPSHVTVALHAEPLAPSAQAAVVYVPGANSSYIVAQGLPPTPAGHGYQLWYADDAGVHPLQVVGFDGSGAFVAPIGVDLANSTAVMITLEPEGGVQGEPGPQVVFGEL